MFAEHNIQSDVFVRLRIITEVEEQWPVEWTTILMKHADLSVVVIQQGIFHLHSSSNVIQYQILRVFWNKGSIVYVWFLGRGAESVVVSGEWIESSDLVPADAELHSSVATETADISTGEWDTHDIVHHNTGNREGHGSVVRLIVSEPSWTIFTHTREGTSWCDHSSLTLALEPFVGWFHLHCSKEGVSF